jgi:hypothetical protein
LGINAAGQAGPAESTHYWCYHGKSKICTIMAGMKGSMNSIILFVYLSIIHITMFIST